MFAEDVMPKVERALDDLSPVIQQASDDIQTLGNWIINNRAAIVFAIVAIGLAFAWAHPAGLLIVGLGLLSAALVLLRTDTENLGIAALETKLFILELIQTGSDWFDKIVGSAGPIGDALVIIKKGFDLAGFGASNLDDDIADVTTRLRILGAERAAQAMFQKLRNAALNLGEAIVSLPGKIAFMVAATKAGALALGVMAVMGDALNRVMRGQLIDVGAVIGAWRDLAAAIAAIPSVLATAVGGGVGGGGGGGAVDDVAAAVGGGGAAAAVSALGDAAEDAARRAAEAWEKALKLIDAKTRAGMLGLSHALAEWGTDISATIIAALADMELAGEKMVDIFNAAVERGFVTLQDIDALVQMGPQAEIMALDFIDAFQGMSSDIGGAIFENLAEAAAKAAQEASDAFVENFNEGLDAIEGRLGGAFGRITGLAGSLTVEGAGVRLEQIELERRLLKIKKNTNPVTIAEAEAIRERLAALNDSMAAEKLRSEAAFIQMQLDRDMLPTVIELNAAVFDEIRNLDLLIGVFDHLSAGIFSVIDATTLMFLGFQELATAILAINAGLVAPGAVTTGGLPGSPTIFIDTLIVQGDPVVALSALGIEGVG